MKNDPFSWVGHTIDGKFRIDEVIGEGGFGVVYRAFHLGFSEPIALKCLKLPPSLPAAERDRFYQSFVTEGRLMHKLSRATPGIVQALDVGAAVSPAGTWTPYLVLEWLHGTPFDKHLAARATEEHGPMSLAAAVSLLDSAAQALAKAHAQGVAHRDIKPANLFVTDTGGKPMMKVLDFGIAKVLTDTQSVTRALEATGGSASIFTPHYGAPEQYNRRFGATGPWTDVFAFALLLVEVVSGRQALEGDDMTQLYIAATDPWHRPTLRARGIEVTDAVENVLLRALHVEPRGRYASVGAFWDALQAAMQGVDPGRLAPPEPRAQARSGELPAAALPRDPAILETEPSEANPSTTALQIARSVPEPSLAAGPSKRPRRAMMLGALGMLAMVAAGAGAVWNLRREQGSLLRVASANLAQRVSSAIAVRPVPAEMVLVPAGTFMMGHASAGKTERPAHPVTISRSFYIDRMEVTVADYARCIEGKRCTPSHVHGPNIDDAEAAKFAPLCNAADPARSLHPINCVDKSQAATYCDFVGKRLPTEAEWEYTARGSDERLYPWGSSAPGCDKGMFARATADGCPKRPRGSMPVGSFPSNASPFGALDMAGNVWEWVADGWDPTAYQKGAVTDPIAPPAEHGVLRGGSWDYSWSVAKSTYRLAFHGTLGHVSTGVRCAKTAD